ncbi:tetratricopeptide repeat protein [Nocardioides sp. NPDC023903]|uniref:SEL1-like repeat protein n=1 Tax=Nocardioides sp. NPDC023903 TaxID=3157195 RepID=UPI0033C859C1
MSVGAAGVVLVGFFKPLLDASSEIWTSRLKNSAERSEAHRILEERHGGPGGRFRHVAEIRERAIVYGVQQAIPLPVGHDGDLSHDLPKYVPRTTDGLLHAKLTARSVTGGMVIVKGESTWGKTRSLLEAVTQTIGTWRIIAPSSASDLKELVDSGLDIRRTVFWLDELAGFLDSPTPLTLEMIRKVIDHGAIIVGTIWKSDFSRLTRQGDRTKQESGEMMHTDIYPAARAVLTSSLVDVVEMFAHFDAQELETATAVSGEDPRWATALAYESHLEPIKVLAAADWLLDRYHRPDHVAGGVVLQTAVELLSINHPEPLPEPTLKNLASLLLPDEIRPTIDHTDWFADAVGWACERYRANENQLGAIAPLTRLGDPSDPNGGYTVPDILIQAARGALPDGRRIDVDMLLDHLSASACASVGRFFYFRDEDDAARPLIEHAAKSDVTTAYLQLGYLLQDEDPEAAMAWCRKAIDAGNTEAHIRLGHILSEQSGREADAETEYRAAIAAGHTDGHYWLGILLSDQPGKEAEAETEYRAAIAAGHTDGHYWLGILLSKQPGQKTKAETEYRAAVDAGHTIGHFGLGNLLSSQPGREDDAETEYRAAIDAGHTEAHSFYGVLLAARPGRESDAEAAFHAAIDAGHTIGHHWLGGHLADQPGRESDAEAAFHAAIDAGHTIGHYWLGKLHADQAGRESDAEAAFQAAIDAGHTVGYKGLGHFLADQPGRESDAEAAFHAAIDAGHTDGHYWLGSHLADQPGRENDAEAAFRAAVGAGDADGRKGLGLFLAHQTGREDDAETAFRAAIATGDTDGHYLLGLFLATQTGREDDAEAAFDAAIAAGNTDAHECLGDLIVLQPGREGEAEAAYRAAIAAGNTTARIGLAELLIDLGRLPEARNLLDDGVAAEDPDAIRTMGALELIDGNSVEAERQLRRAVELGVEGAAELLARAIGGN